MPCTRIRTRSRKNINENIPFLLPPHALGLRYIERPRAEGPPFNYTVIIFYYCYFLKIPLCSAYNYYIIVVVLLSYRYYRVQTFFGRLYYFHNTHSLYNKKLEPNITGYSKISYMAIIVLCEYQIIYYVSLCVCFIGLDNKQRACSRYTWRTHDLYCRRYINISRVIC